MKSLESELRNLDRVAYGERTVEGLDAASTEEQVLASVEGRVDLLNVLEDLRPGQVGYLASRVIARAQKTLALPAATVDVRARHGEEHPPRADNSVTRASLTPGKPTAEWRQSL